MTYYDSIIDKPLNLNHPANILREVVGLSGKAYDWEVLKQLAFEIGLITKENNLVFDNTYRQFMKAARRAGWTFEVISTDIYTCMHKGFNA